LIVADTDVLIDYLCGTEPAAERIAVELRAGHLGTTSVTRFELLSGARTLREENQLRELLESMDCLPLDVDAADRAAAVRRELERRRATIGMGDSMIAGIVLAAGGILLTRNRKHFERVTGLKLATLSTLPSD